MLYKICGWHFNPSCFLQELETLNYQLRDERDHCDRLEDQIRDLTELHQHEIISIRAGVTDMEEKVQYQSEERLLDIREHLQSLENKLTAVEHQVYASAADDCFGCKDHLFYLYQKQKKLPLKENKLSKNVFVSKKNKWGGQSSYLA